MERSRSRLPSLALFAWAGLAALAALLLAYAAVVLVPLGDAAVQDAFGRWVYDAVALGAAAVVLLRAARVESERIAWLSLGIGMLLWALAQTYYSAVLYYADPAPFPSASDALFLAFYPFTYLALVRLLRSRSRRVDSFAWVDGLIGALAIGALAAAAIFPPVLEALGGKPLGVAVSLAYPCADVVLLGLIAGALTTSRWNLRGAWPLIACALILFGASDVVYLSVAGQSTQALNLASVGWPLALLLLAAAAWLPTAQVDRREGWTNHSIALPVVLATTVVALLAIGNLTPIGPIAVGLGVASLLAVLTRLVTTFAFNLKMLNSREHEATTDPLTGLRNRRSLLADLEVELSRAEPRPCVLALFDLDGFKTYNDSFGHTAGDELLKRLGTNLATATEPWGAGYRLGGDEFCLLIPTDAVKAETAVKAAEAALSERGPSFSITASWGMVRLPAEAETPKEALHVADRRMYTKKNQRADSVLSQTRSVLLGMLRERAPALDRHLGGVAHLAGALGKELDLDPEEMDILLRAAEMHDIGKIAIPDEILRKTTLLTEAEHELVRAHPVVGERVLAAAPALREVARLVRSSHESWDGSGYPDGLAGEDIPLGSRVILICDAYCAMTGERPYSRPMTPDEATAELRRAAGSQFDPRLVEIFIERVAPLARPGASVQR